MKSVFVVCLVALISACSQIPNEVPTASESAGVHYPLYDWSQPVDFTALRNQIGWSAHYEQRCQLERPTKKVVDALNDQQWGQAAELASTWLNRCPIDLRAHYFASVAYREQGNSLKADLHTQWTEGLMASITASGDGHSPESAFVTISVPEEYDVLYLFGLRSVSQTLVNSSPVCDVIRAVDRQGNKMDIYFAPHAHFARLETQLLARSR